jgi:hypothetical protein
MASLDLKEIS